MPGLIDNDQGLVYGTGLIWLTGGLGGDGTSGPVVLPDLMDRFSALIHDRAGQIIQARGQAIPEDIYDSLGAVIEDRFGSPIQTSVPIA